jgi:molybdate transport system regulatory protein
MDIAEEVYRILLRFAHNAAMRIEDDHAADFPRARIRVHLDETLMLGPGKAELLEGIAATGSIAEAGRRMGMSYQRAWSLVQTLNAGFAEPLVERQRGGSGGGGARLTATGEQVLTIYRAIEREAQKAVDKRAAALAALRLGGAAG